MSRRYSWSKLLTFNARPARFYSRSRPAIRPIRLESLEHRSLLTGLEFSTYLGGTFFSNDYANDIAVDSSGNSYVVGETEFGIPVTPGAYDTTKSGSFDVYVAKFAPNGALIWATYLGGSGTSLGGNGGESGRGIAVDGLGNVYVTGNTASSDFPTTPGAFDTTFNGGSDAFVTKLNPTGSALIYSTYLGGNFSDGGEDIALDASGNAYVMGPTSGGGFPTTPGAFDSTNYTDFIHRFFVAKLNTAGSSLEYSTYVGQSFNLGGIAVDALGNAYVTGDTNADDFPRTPGAFDTTHEHGADAFVTKLNPTGSALVYSTFLGGSVNEGALGIAVDSAGSAYVTGWNQQGNFPTTPGAFDTTVNGTYDAFVTKLNLSGSALEYSTYLGGNSDDAYGNLGLRSLDIAIDDAGNAYVTGVTRSTDFPTTPGAFDRTYNGGVQDSFLTKLNATGSALLYSTYLGGNANDYGRGIALDNAGNAHVAGVTNSADFPTTPGALDTTFDGGFSAGFVSKICTNLVTLSAVDDFSNTTNTATSAWSYRWSSDKLRDGTYGLLTTNSVLSGWNTLAWNGNGAIIGANQSGATINHASIPLAWPDDTMLIAPPGGLAVVSWLSPISGLIDIRFSYQDIQGAGGGDGVRYFVDRNDLSGQLATGLVPDPGSTGLLTLNNVSVTAGDRINFVLDSLINSNNDTILSTASITFCNSPPVANAGGPYPVLEGGSVLLTGAGSDPDADPLTYAWDLDNNGSFETPGQNVLFSAVGRDGPGAQPVVLRVTDIHGASATSPATISIGNVAPTIAISGNANVDEGSTYNLTLGSVTDPGTDTVTSYIVHWGDGFSDTYSTNGVTTHTYPDGFNSYDITVDLIDEDGPFLDRANALAVAVASVQVAGVSGANAVDEGSAYTLFLEPNDPGADTITSWFIDWGDGSPVQEVPGNPPSVNHTFVDGPNSHFILAWFANEDGNSDGALKTVTVNNVPPNARANTYITAQATSVSGNVLTDGIPDSDPAGTNDPLTVISNTTPANGTLSLGANGSFTYTPDTTFSGDDTFDYTISDGDGGTATATVTIHVSPAAAGSILTIPDCCLGGTALLITGTELSDTIVVEPGTTSATLKVTLNGVETTETKPSGRIIVAGGGGDDFIQIAGAVMNQACLYGDGGHDRLNAGNGGSLLIGGEGNDQLLGGGGRDVMIGGEGADRLIGNASDDILVASLTTKDKRSTAGHEKFWCHVLAEWNSDNTFAIRVQNLRDGTGGNAHNSGSLLLPNVLDDVFADEIDFLIGSSGEDWLIFLTGEDKVVGQVEASN